MKNEGDHSQLMNEVYRVQRYIYDITRKYFLFGRDTLISEMQISKGSRVLEVGVGTARNLIKLSRRHTDATFYGLDASTEMLQTARGKVEQVGLSQSVVLRYGLAETFGFAGEFDLEEPFDVIFLSYSLSMFADWQAAVDNAFLNIKPGGKLYIVDFWDQNGYPRWFAKVLQWWLGKFHVAYQPDALKYLESKAKEDGAQLSLKPIGNRYAFVLCYQTNGAI